MIFLNNDSKEYILRLFKAVLTNISYRRWCSSITTLRRWKELCYSLECFTAGKLIERRKISDHFADHFFHLSFIGAKLPRCCRRNFVQHFFTIVCKYQTYLLMTASKDGHQCITEKNRRRIQQGHALDL